MNLRHCSNCGDPTYIVAKGLCPRCYHYQRRTGNLPNGKRSDKPEIICACGRKAAARGMCHNCYNRQYQQELRAAQKGLR